MLYNDAYSAFAGGRHPDLLGSKVRDGWPEVAAFNDNVMRVGLAGGTLSYRDQELTLYRHGHPEQVWMDLNYSPVLDDGYRPVGVLCVLAETTERVTAEERLRESEAQLRLATEAAEIGLWDVDEANGLMFWPARVKAMFGISPDVPVSMADYYAGLHPDDREATSAAYAAAADPVRRAVYDVEYRTIGKEDGVVRWVAAKGRGIFERDRCVRVIGTAIDITARKRTEAALVEREAHLKAVFTQAGAGLALTDLSGRFTDVNDTYCALVGRSREQVLHLTMQEITHPDDLVRNVPLFEAAARHGTAFDIEKRYLRPCGRIVWIRNNVSAVRAEDGTVAAMLAVSVDITARVEAEAALRESEARQRALIEGVPQLVWRAAGAGMWTWASPQWTAYTGQSEADSHGRGWLGPIHPDDRERALDAWSKAAHLGALDVEYRLHNAAEDRYAWFQTRAVPVRDANGRIREWLGTSTDIDHLRRLQEQQQVMVAELQHRTRNLIAVVTSIAHETLAQTGPGDAFVAQFDDRLAALSRVQSLLSRAAESPITIEALVRMELQALGVSERHVGLDGPPVQLRPSTVQTLALAIHELATNARKYGALAAPRGTLEVAWRLQREDGSEGIQQWLVIDWVENGIDVPLRKAGVSHHRGYGRELIEEALPFALGARTNYTLDARGVRCRMELPLDRRSARETRA